MTAPRALRLSDRIENDIVTGTIAPGARLDETSLARRFGVSRTPVREALRELAATGLVRIEPNRGVFVMEMGVGDLIERFEVMAELEGLCGRLAARRITDPERVLLMETHARCGEAARAGDADAYYYENERFHRVIYDASHNRFLADQAATLHRRLKPYRRLQLRARGRLERSYAEHGEMVGAILAGDGEGAERLVKAHILIQGERFNDFVASLSDTGTADPTQKGDRKNSGRLADSDSRPGEPVRVSA